MKGGEILRFVQNDKKERLNTYKTMFTGFPLPRE
jgi:hypothetical protein